MYPFTKPEDIKISNCYLILWNNVIGEVNKAAELWRQDDTVNRMHSVVLFELVLHCTHRPCGSRWYLYLLPSL